MPTELAARQSLIIADADGVRRVAGTRVTLDTVVAAFREGATPEEIAQRYPVLELADIYEVVACYLRHHAEVDRYLAGRERAAAAVRDANEGRSPREGIRERLLARRGAV